MKSNPKLLSLIFFLAFLFISPNVFAVGGTHTIFLNITGTLANGSQVPINGFRMEATSGFPPNTVAFQINDSTVSFLWTDNKRISVIIYPYESSSYNLEGPFNLGDTDQNETLNISLSHNGTVPASNFLITLFGISVLIFLFYELVSNMSKKEIPFLKTGLFISLGILGILIFLTLLGVL